MKKYTSPFSIYIVWHPDFEAGSKIADYLYASFTRDTEAPLNRGIGIPVYYRSKPVRGISTPKPIPLLEADYNAIVVLVDDHLFNDDTWNTFVKTLIPLCNDKTRIFPVSFSENAHYFEESTLGGDQFIKSITINGRYKEDKLYKSLIEVRSRLLHSFCRLLLGKKPFHQAEEELSIPAPVQLFISHAKKDSEKDAEAFRDHVRSKTKLSTFFDASEIADSYRFDFQIKKAIEDGHAALVVFHSDTYASREWCQIEILTAKRYKSPIVVVHNISKGEGRSFPYLGNVPTIKFVDKNFDEIIDLTLYQILINVYQKMHLLKIKDIYVPDQFISIELTSPPELFNFLDIISSKDKSSKKKLIVLYPDPPLGIDEMKVLNDMNDKIQFSTPIQLSTLIK